MRRLAAGALAAWLGTGCVLKADHELVQVQLDATRTALSTRAAEWERSIRELEGRLDRYEVELEESEVRVEQLRTLSELKDAELESVVAEEVGLADELRKALTEIETLKATIARYEERERLRDRRRRRRDDPGGAPPEKPDDEALTAADRIALSEGRRALAKLEARVLAQLEHERIVQLDERTHEVVREDLAELVQQGFLTVERTDHGTVIRIPTRRLFQEGWATLSPRGEQIVDTVGRTLDDLPGRIVEVSGHTDDEPVHTAQFASNWERGFGRAVVVLRQLLETAPHLRISASSYASSQPLVPHDEPGAAERNRRVEIEVRADPSLLDRVPVDDAPDGLDPDGLAPDGLAPDGLAPDGEASDDDAADGRAPDEAAEESSDAVTPEEAAPEAGTPDEPLPEATEAPPEPAEPPSETAPAP